MMNHVVAKDQIDFFEENKQNIQIMQKIVEQKLDLNDGVSNEIKQLFETFLYVSIEQITQVCLLKNGNYQSSQLDQDQNNYTVVKYLYKTNLLDRKRMPDEDLTKIKGFFQNNLFPKDGNKITNQIIEIQNYHEKKQSGLRLTATKMYDVCLYEKWNQDDNFLNEATQYGQEHEKVALEKYASQHPDIKLKFTDVLINLNYPYICGKPDALIYDNHDNLIGIIEVKSPFLKQDLDLNEDENFRLNYIEMNEDKEYILKKNHQYYYQVQVYLLITELPGCIFIVSTKKGNREIIVKKDEALIKQIKKKAEYFYFTQILPNQCQLQKKIIEEEDLIRIKEIERLDRI
ncbi:unnamed protein product [Paramecium sonneborni]|uniref:YqaJ viral recombinase domain-containing protein n=1 Tax=Paramecium sonneborni TaxID=65129 RepID=A0A8S1KJ47_9CILI|nr:unnamed protein product [Paramecium sonneborni]